MLYALMEDLAALLSTEFSGALEVSAGLRPRPSFEELPTGRPYRAWVVPESVKVELGGRTVEAVTCKLNLVLACRTSTDALLQKDFMDLVEGLASWASLLELAPDGQRAVCTATEIEPAFAVEQLDQGECLTSVIALTFVSYGSLP